MKKVFNDWENSLVKKKNKNLILQASPKIICGVDDNIEIMFNINALLHFRRAKENRVAALPPLLDFLGLKKIYVMRKRKTNFLKKLQPGVPHIFFYEFLKFSILPVPQYAEKNLKNSHIYTCSLTILWENFKIFDLSSLKVWMFEFWLFTFVLLQLAWRNRAKNFLAKFYIMTNILGEFQPGRWKCRFRHLMQRHFNFLG